MSRGDSRDCIPPNYRDGHYRWLATRYRNPAAFDANGLTSESAFGLPCLTCGERLGDHMADPRNRACPDVA